MYKLFIFDLDGTLIDSGEGIKKALGVFEDKLHLKHFPKEEAGFIVGPPIIESLHKTHPELPEESLQELSYVFDEVYDENLLYNIFAYDGIKELLDMIHEKGGIVAIDTAKLGRQATRVLKECNLQEKIDYIEPWSEEKNNKPLLMNDVIKHFDIPKEKIVAIGDSHFDGEAANINNIDLIAVKYGYGFGKVDDEKEFNPKFVANTVKELTKFVEENIEK